MRVTLNAYSAAMANGLTIYTRNPHDFVGLEQVIEVIAV